MYFPLITHKMGKLRKSSYVLNTYKGIKDKEMYKQHKNTKAQVTTIVKGYYIHRKRKKSKKKIVKNSARSMNINRTISVTILHKSAW